jgi:chemotaxis protein MotB
MNIRPRTSLVLAMPFAAIMLSGCVVSQSSYDALKAQNDQLQQQTNAQAAELAAEKAQVARLAGAIKYTVNSDLLFTSGGWQLSDAGKKIISTLAAKLAPSQQNKIVVNGYTDNAPIGAALQKQGVASNEVLSQKRADNVRDFLIAQGLSADIVSAKGYGDADPVAPNTTPKGRAQNRRVELALAPPA